VDAEPDIAALGALLADDARSSMLLALLGGDALSAGELARVARVSPSGATAHLRRLREGGLVVDEVAGRNRFFQLASAELADALEALALVAPPRRRDNLAAAESARALKRARTCYDHLAGELGVALTESLVARALLECGDESYAVTPAGGHWLRRLGIDVLELERQRRSFARVCLDWSERRPHLAGSLGAALAAAFFARGWARRLPRGRAIAVTPAGAAWLEGELGLSVQLDA
jgi:DNA-binding transcriptional ArsR family regulator